MKRFGIVIGGSCLLGAIAACQAPARVAPPAASCRADVPAELTTRPARWLGECRGGAAEGLGVTRAGAGAPYEFFAGRMRAGRLVDGVLVLKSGLMMVAVRFDAGRRVVVSDGLTPSEDEAVFRTATAGAGSGFDAHGSRRQSRIGGLLCRARPAHLRRPAGIDSRDDVRRALKERLRQDQPKTSPSISLRAVRRSAALVT